MNNIIDAFKKQANTDRKTYYLFLVPGFSDDLAGFMPLGRNYGFIATENATTIANTIGHELGHGAFVLYHPFSDKSPYYRPECSTDNLMDYSDGTFLNKYQWDLINDPRRIVRVMQDEGEGKKLLLTCRNINVSNYPDGYFKDVPYNNEKLIEYISKNDLWENKYISDILEDIKNKIILDYHFQKMKNKKEYFFNEDKMLTKNNSVPTTDEWRKGKAHFDILYQEWDHLLFESSRAKSCNSYNEKEASAYKKEMIKKLVDHFIGKPSGFIWIDGTEKEIPDPRTYFDAKTNNYEFERLKEDIRKVVYAKQSELLKSTEESLNLLESIQQSWLSMYAEYMYKDGYLEIPNTTVSQRNEIKNQFNELWGTSDQWGFYWKWYRLKEKRLEQERQKLLERLAAEEAVRKYLEDKESEAVMAMISGGVGTVAGVAIIIIFPPSSVAAAIWGVADVGLSAATFAEGVGMYSDIQNGFFDPNKHYNVVEGICYSISEEKGALFYDLTTVALGVRSVRGNYLNITKIKKIKGNELKAILLGVSGGKDAIEIGDKIYELKKK